MTEDVQPQPVSSTVPPAVRSRFRDAMAAAGEGAWERAKEGFETVLAAAPDWPRAHLGQGRALLGRHRPAEAAQAFQRALEAGAAGREALEAIEGLGRAHAMREDRAAVEACFALLAGRRLDAPVPVRDLARLALGLGESVQALGLLDALLATGHDAAETRVLRYHCQTHRGTLTEARAEIDRALELEPDNLEARGERLRFLWAIGEEARALLDAEFCIAAGVNDADTHWAHGHLLKRAGRHEDAAQAYERFRAALPEGTP